MMKHSSIEDIDEDNENKDDDDDMEKKLDQVKENMEHFVKLFK